MPTKAELEQTRADLAATTFTLPQFLEAIRTKKNYAYKTTPWYRALMAVADPKAELDRLLALQIAQLEPSLPNPDPVPPTTGTVWHQDGFETQTFQSWSYAQPTMAQAGTWVDGLRAGSKALRVTLRAGDANQTGLEAAQLTKVNPGSYRLGTTDIYPVRFRLVSVTDCFDFLTFAYPVIRYGAISLNVTGGQVCLHMNTGRTVSDAPPSHDFQVWADPLSNVALGQWQDMILTVKRATDGTGSLRIEQRYDGAGSFRVVWERTAIPTAQWGVAVAGWGAVDALGINVTDATAYAANKAGQPREVVDKLGPYRAKQPVGAPDFVVDYDVHRAVTSRDLALAALA
jgi:hypothetical protein